MVARSYALASSWGLNVLAIALSHLGTTPTRAGERFCGLESITLSAVSPVCVVWEIIIIKPRCKKSVLLFYYYYYYYIRVRSFSNADGHVHVGLQV